MTCARLRNAASGVLIDPSISLNDHGRRKIKMKIQKLKVEVGKKNRNAALGVLNDPSMSLNDHGRRKIEMKIQKLKLKKKSFRKIFEVKKSQNIFYVWDLFA